MRDSVDARGARVEFDRSRALFGDERTTKLLDDFLRANADELGFPSDAITYYGFPLYKGDEEVLVARVLIASPAHGVFVIASSDAHTKLALSIEATTLGEVYSHVYSKLLRSKLLRASKQTLSFGVHAIIYAPSARDLPADADDVEILVSDQALRDALANARRSVPLEPPVFAELRAVIEGAKGLIRPKKRDVEEMLPQSKGQQASQAEQEILSFDADQRRAAIRQLEGPQRIRGLAGSGKTVVLAMKAAQLHLRYPDAKILYTFSTRSLYQHVQRLITRFYRQFADEDPRWENLRILHAWGGASTPGVYSETARQLGQPVLAYRDALEAKDAFDYVVSKLTESAVVEPVYDYVLVDEAQDFPLSFLKLAAALAKGERFVLAADELQNIFQVRLPEAKDILGEGRQFTEDVVLHKCYRNPREVLVSAHALGFGLYGERIVQMLEDKEHWEVVGYRVEGQLVQGETATIVRPPENSLQSISKYSSFDDIIRVTRYEGPYEEAAGVAESIRADIADGLRADDIVVVSVDDRNAKLYFNQLSVELNRQDPPIRVNNVHAAYGAADFHRDGEVTLSTVHKAKGNEGFMVYVVGVDALFAKPITKKKRNMLFTAMTRTKGWLRVSGCGDLAKECAAELARARENFPRLVFKYPDARQLDLIRRDREDEEALRAALAEKLKSGDLTDEQLDTIREVLGAAAAPKKQGSRTGDGGPRG
jgi:superfamily I DNA and RNA helicase